MNAMSLRFSLGIAALASLTASGCHHDPGTEHVVAPVTMGKTATGQTTFSTPEAAGRALVDAAERYDVPALKQILGPDGVDLVTTGDAVQDKNQATAFAAQARKKMVVVREPATAATATLNIGEDDWPVPVPLVQQDDHWRFDTEAGRQEVLNRRIGANELDAIQVCHGYFEAQQAYAAEKHDGAQVNHYALRVISTPGKQDGLAWQAADGTWEGPVGRKVADFIAEGYTDKMNPFHGYFFKILKSQGPHAPMGEMDFMIKDLMIGGFALVAAPANYGVTGVKSFIVGPEGVVYEKDLGATTGDQFKAMERFDPDASWSEVKEP